MFFLKKDGEKEEEEKEEMPTRIISLEEFGEMCARGRIVVAYQVRRSFS